MKKTFLKTILVLATFALCLLPALGQSPEKMSYQAVIRNSSNVLVTDTQVGMQISILQGSESGTAVYVETQTPTTNSNGLVSVEIGTGTTSDDFATIDWASGPYYIKTETDPAGSTDYTITGTNQLLSVPYALYAKTAGANSGLPVYTTTEIAALSPAQGDAVFNSTENLYQVYVNSAWQSFNANCWPQPTTANAGTNQTFTDGTITAILAANTPEAEHGTGAWTIISGTGGSFADATDPTSTFSGQLYESYELQWSITTSCAISTDNVNVFFGQNGAGETITDVEGNSYNTVWIGPQQWMAENLKTTKYNNGTDIPLVTDNTAWEELTTPGYCWYDNDQATYGDTYGALYNWYTVETGNLCPAGWHVPTDAEWTQLTDYLGGESVAGGKLKEAGTTHWSSPNEGATNESGFTALPGGLRIADGVFYSIGSYDGYWWSATEYDTDADYALFRSMTQDDSTVLREWGYKTLGFSVRCLRD